MFFRQLLRTQSKQAVSAVRRYSTETPSPSFADRVKAVGASAGKAIERALGCESILLTSVCRAASVQRQGRRRSRQAGVHLGEAHSSDLAVDHCVGIQEDHPVGELAHLVVAHRARRRLEEAGCLWHRGHWPVLDWRDCACFANEIGKRRIIGYSIDTHGAAPHHH